MMFYTRWVWEPLYPENYAFGPCVTARMHGADHPADDALHERPQPEREREQQAVLGVGQAEPRL